MSVSTVRIGCVRAAVCKTYCSDMRWKKAIGSLLDTKHKAKASEMHTAPPSMAMLCCGRLWLSSKILLVSIYKANPDNRSREYSFTGSIAGVVADILFLCKKKNCIFGINYTIVYTHFHKTKQSICSWLIGYLAQFTILPYSFKKLLQFLFLANTHISPQWQLIFISQSTLLQSVASTLALGALRLMLQPENAAIHWPQLQAFTLFITAPKRGFREIAEHHLSLGMWARKHAIDSRF